jgi:hypothetical protein
LSHFDWLSGYLIAFHGCSIEEKMMIADLGGPVSYEAFRALFKAAFPDSEIYLEQEGKQIIIKTGLWVERRGEELIVMEKDEENGDD